MIHQGKDHCSKLECPIITFFYGCKAVNSLLTISKKNGDNRLKIWCLDRKRSGDK